MGVVEAASFEIFVHCEVGQGFVLTAELTGELCGVFRGFGSSTTGVIHHLHRFRFVMRQHGQWGWCGWFAHREEVHHGGLLRSIAVPVGWG